MDSWKDVIEGAGSQAEVARRCKVGRPAVSGWIARNHVPPHHWRAILSLYPARGPRPKLVQLVALCERVAA